MIKNNKKGFTLIELLAVIVILGLLMAIAIPSITKYITESRKKTAISTVQNYMSAIMNEVNDMVYTFTASNTIYAVPIECISVERGGNSPFGEWMQANNSYWAYVLVQYDEKNSSYTYGFTFKDSAGYGMYPTSQEKMIKDGNQIQTNLILNKPTDGSFRYIADMENWSGFNLLADTELVVLEAQKEDIPGDGINTCTLRQKGKNYDDIEVNVDEENFADVIKKGNEVKTNATLNKTSQASGDNGLYISKDTNNGKPTYYFRGVVDNNYVSFAGLIWRIVRINENESVRLILDDRINGTVYSFANSTDDIKYMYYSESDSAKPQIDQWYNEKLSTYDSYIAKELFCEQAKIKIDVKYNGGNAELINYTEYKFNFNCATDGNGKGIIYSKIGLISADEGWHAGASSNSYLNKGYGYFTMSPSGIDNNYIYEVGFGSGGTIVSYGVSATATRSLRPVINLIPNITATGTGTSEDPYIIETK